MDIYQWQIQDFPLEVPSHWGGTNLRCGCFSAKTYTKMKELDPVGGACAGSAPWICQCLSLVQINLHGIWWNCFKYGKSTLIFITITQSAPRVTSPLVYWLKVYDCTK